MIKLLPFTFFLAWSPIPHASEAFVPTQRGWQPLFNHRVSSIHRKRGVSTSGLYYINEKGAGAAVVETREVEETAHAPLLSGTQLEQVLSKWDDGPVVVVATASWCRPCQRMSQEFEAAAREMSGKKVRLVQIDVDDDRKMARRLNVSTVPTLLFLDKYKGEAGEKGKPKAELKEKVEGTVKKDVMKALCEYHFFGGPRPKTW